MATGSGKTVAMALLLAWAFCNRGRTPAGRCALPRSALVVCRNLTIKERLAVPRRDDADNRFDKFDPVANPAAVFVRPQVGYAIGTPGQQTAFGFEIMTRDAARPSAARRSSKQQINSHAPLKATAHTPPTPAAAPA